ncbi:hypothetical protein J3F83DRAFT_738631 [Trichoderma novae-zelandiae]
MNSGATLSIRIAFSRMPNGGTLMFLCNGWCYPLVTAIDCQTPGATGIIWRPELGPKVLLTTHAHEPTKQTNACPPPPSVPGGGEGLNCHDHSYRELASPMISQDPPES